MSKIDIVPEVLWQPDPERVARARITDFAAFAAARSARDLSDYGSLWSFSTTDLEGSGPQSLITSRCAGIGRQRGFWRHR